MINFLFPDFEDKNIQIKHNTLISYALFLFALSFFTAYSTFNVGSDKTVFIFSTLPSLIIPVLVIIFSRRNFKLVSNLLIGITWASSSVFLLLVHGDNSVNAFLITDLFIISALASLSIRWFIGIIYGFGSILIGCMDLYFESREILNIFHLSPIPTWIYFIGITIMLGTILIVVMTNALSFEKVFKSYNDELNKRISAENLLIKQNLALDEKVKERTQEIIDLNVALTSSNKKLFQTNKELTDLLPQSVFEVDNNGMLRFINKVGYDLFGYTVEDFLAGINILSTISEEDRTKASINFQKALKNDSNQGNKYTAVKKDGTKFPIQIYSGTIFEDEKPVGLRGIIIDITERENAEKALKESEERYRSIIASFVDMIMISDVKGNIIFANEPLRQITGITEDDYSNPNRIPHIHPDDMAYVKDNIRELMSGDALRTNMIENRFIDSKGNLHWFSGISSKISVNGEIMLQTVTRDITEKKKSDEELENHRTKLEFLVKERTEELAAINEELVSTNEEIYNQQKILEAALTDLQNAQKHLVQNEKMASLGILSAGVAHEINNPLNFISGGIQGIETYLNDNLIDHVENLDPLINAINTGVQRAADIVKSLNRFSRQTDSSDEECDLHTIINNCLVMLHNQTKDIIKITKQFTDDSFKIKGNEGKLHQVILNILSNAIQALNGKGTITISTKLNGEFIILNISDNGHGIEKEVLSRIFDPFFTTKEPGKGTGLGLAICYQIIQEFKGNIEILSEKGNGTTALITLPVGL
jgi:PAS domain S-box-containing protein